VQKSLEAFEKLKKASTAAPVIETKLPTLEKSFDKPKPAPEIETSSII